MFNIATEGASEGLLGGGGSSTIIMIVVFVAIFYFLIIRPQQKRKKETDAMMSALKVGDEIYTAGGILGVITKLKERTIWMRVSEKTEIELLKTSIGGKWSDSGSDK